MSKNFYVYYSYEEFGRGYIGSRGCKCLPKDDVKYFGSFWDKTFHPTQKIILAEFDNREDAYDAEISLHKFYDVVNNPHFANQSRALSSGFTTEGRVAPNRGKKASEETRRKIGASSKGRKVSDETRKLKSKQMSGEGNHMYGRTHTPEAREKIGAAQRGKTISEEHKKKIREANTGRRLSPEVIEMLREINTGRTVSEETRRKMREANRNRVISDETRKKLSIAGKKGAEALRLKKLHHPQDTNE